MHVGNVRTALFNWFFARKNGGSLVVRIEDTDAERSERRYEDQLLEDLRWLGIEWDEGVDKGGDVGPYRQTERFPLYRERVEQLLGEGRAYHCFCSQEQLEADRKKQLAEGQSIRYVGRCSELDPKEAKACLGEGRPATVRLRVRPGSVSFQDLVFGLIEVDTDNVGDFILLRSDGSAQYNLACVVDDSMMGITHVIRGEGHISNTPRQILIFEGLGLQVPEFAHLSTILGPDGAKLSKRHGATSLAEFRQLGYLPEAVVNYLALLGWAPPEDGNEILSPEDIVSAFDLKSVNVSPATFDLKKFNWVNRSHLKECPLPRLLTLAEPFLEKAGLVGTDPTLDLQGWTEDLLSVVVGYLDRLEDLGKETEFLWNFDPASDLKDPRAEEILEDSLAVEVIRSFCRKLEEVGAQEVSYEVYREAVLGVMKSTGAKGKSVFRPIRLAITGRASGPELDKVIPLIEKGSQLALQARIMDVQDRVQRVVGELDLR
jgi:glutamyl-tRNA synthetase/nondiscriminating glutamyl-tRNA synthetase